MGTDQVVFVKQGELHTAAAHIYQKSPLLDQPVKGIFFQGDGLIAQITLLGVT